VDSVNSSVISRDGTPIAFERSGDGPPVVLVDGALCTRTTGPAGKLAPYLEDRFTVYTYDRRGRGGSGDTAPYAVAREVEDIAALIDHAGGRASVFGSSSGASLALESARQGLQIDRLALYEAPMIVDGSRPPVGDRYVERLDELIRASRRGKAIKVFMREGIRVPAAFVHLMPLLPVWGRLEAIADTLVYDSTIVEEHLHGAPLPEQRWSTVVIPTLVAAGGKSPRWMQNAMEALADALPNAEHLTVERATHIVKASQLAPVLTEFFGRRSGPPEAATRRE
jgi:pimeloyl-ACP methyl ester carboxylesterase